MVHMKMQNNDAHDVPSWHVTMTGQLINGFCKQAPASVKVFHINAIRRQFFPTKCHAGRHCPLAHVVYTTLDTIAIHDQIRSICVACNEGNVIL